MSLKDKLVNSRRSEIVEINGDKFKVVEPSFAQLKTAQKMDNGLGYLIIHTLQDEAGNFVFTEADSQVVDSLPASAVQTIDNAHKLFIVAPKKS